MLEQAASRAGRPQHPPRRGKLGRTAATVLSAPPSEWRLLHSRLRAGRRGRWRDAEVPLLQLSALQVLPEDRASARLLGWGPATKGTRWPGTQDLSVGAPGLLR